MADDFMLQEIINALSEGQRLRARDLLTRLLRTDQKNPTYWVWMSSVVDTQKERIYCLESALHLDPMNRTAMRGLVLLGAHKPEPGTVPTALVRRKWQTASNEEINVSESQMSKAIAHPVIKFVSLVGVGLVIISLVLVGILGFRNISQQKIAIVQVTLPAWTAAPPSVTPTVLPTYTPVVRSPTPTFIGPTPLWMLLKATYTPLPVYISTPHGVSEAFSAGMRAMRRGDYSNMLSFMQQANQVDPNAPDIYYYLGEAYRLLGDNQHALKAYLQASNSDANFAPAYLGQARILMATNTKAGIEADIKKAIQLDPNLADAYIIYADYLIQQGEAKIALEELKKAEDIAPYLPILYVYESQADLSLGLHAEALQAAQQAHDMDSTLLPAYLALAQVHFANGNYDLAKGFMDTYLIYVTDDLNAWLMTGQINLAEGKDYQAALDAFTQVLSLDKRFGQAYYYRGETYLALDQGQKAVNDLAVAVQIEPNSFDYNLQFGHALLSAGRALDAYRALQAIEKLAKKDEQKASLYYWEALSLEQAGNSNAAINAWNALLKLPKLAAPPEMIKTAQEHLLTFSTPTATRFAAVITPSATVTPTPKANPTNTGAPTATSSTTPALQH
jgi:tetratricopeptide (TPR) repeat protein